MLSNVTLHNDLLITTCSTTLHMQDFQRAIATLAFSPTTKCATYRALFEPSHWLKLEQQFMQVRGGKGEGRKH